MTRENIQSDGAEVIPATDSPAAVIRQWPGSERHVLGMRVHATNYREATQLILDWSEARESRYVCEAPVHMVMEAFDDPDYQKVINGADLVVPGGMPIVWFLRASGLRGQPRVYGPQLTLQVCQAAAQMGTPVGFYGGTPKAVAEMARRLIAKYPGLQVRHLFSPPFRPPTQEEKARTIEEIRQSGCRILFVGLGCPKQERWMAEHKGALPVVMLGVGAAFDFLSGQKPQAFPWMQRMGLEWMFRLATEPRRLWRRYAYHNPRFVVLAARQWWRERVWRPSVIRPRAPLPRGAAAPLEDLPESEEAFLERALRGKRVHLAVKRFLDISLAALGLVLLAPMLALVAAMIMIESPGGALFRQTRVGYRGREFRICKFRTMHCRQDPGILAEQHRAREEGRLVKMKSDPRVTRLGRWLRATSLDELPQLFNVLRGEMSLVGPRPLIPLMLDPYPDFRRVRSLVRPGITGLWQVRARMHNTSAAAMMPHDLEYVRDFSLGRDLKILGKTLGAVVSAKGAY